jgi:hypothetical protein
VRVPRRKLYRAFPELDAFSNQQCERFLAVALRGGLLRQLWVSMVAMGLGLAAFVGVVWLGLWAARWLPLAYRRTLMVDFPGMAYTAGVLAGACLSLALVAFVVRDVWIRRRIRRHLVLWLCERCGYRLLGVPARAGRVTCPECGHAGDLADRALTQAEYEAMLEPAAATGKAETPTP